MEVINFQDFSLVTLTMSCKLHSLFYRLHTTPQAKSPLYLRIQKNLFILSELTN